MDPAINYGTNLGIRINNAWVGGLDFFGSQLTFTASTLNGFCGITSVNITTNSVTTDAYGYLETANIVFTYTYAGSNYQFSASTDINTSSASYSITLVSSAPTVTSVAPSSGSAAGGTSVVLTGTNFTGATAVKFGATNASSFTVNSSTQITATAPSGSAGTVNITVTTSGGTSATSASNQFTYFTVPGAPTIGTATAGNTQASVTFTAPASNGGSTITGYTVTSSPGGLTGTGTSSPITVTGLTNGTAYTFSVTATNAAGTGSASAASNSVTPAASQTITFNNPGAQNFGTTPTLTATATSGLTVAFTSATTGVCTITSGGALTFVTTGTCTINANQAGNSSFTAAPQVQQSFTVNPVVPGAPMIGTATAGNAQASVTFTAPASNGGASISSYTVTSSPGGITGTGSSSPITVTGLTNGTAYTFTVTATNTAGTGSASSASNSVTPAASQTISFSNPGAQNFGTTPTLTATATSGLTVAFTSATTGVCTITSGGALTFVTTGTCTINANQAGNSSFTAASQVQQSFTVNAVIPGAPTIGTATAGNAQASVTFTAPAFNGGSSITGYTVTSSPGGFTATGASSPITVTGLTNGTAYTFTVTATNAAGTSSASTASGSVTPYAALTTSVAQASVTGTAGSALTAVTPVTASSGVGTLSYAISPTLPTGLSFSTTTRQITGTPTALLAATTFTVTATDQTTPTAQTSSKTFSLTINRATTTTSLTASTSAPAVGASVTFTAIIAGGSSPTGTVTFFDGATSLGNVSLTGTSASLSISSLSAGSHSITATYNGDTNNATSTSAATSITVGGRPNPAQNANVVGLTTAQVAFAMRNAQTQIANSQRRLEQIHDEADADFAAPERSPREARGSRNGLGQPIGRVNASINTDSEINANKTQGTAGHVMADGYSPWPYGGVNAVNGILGYAQPPMPMGAASSNNTAQGALGNLTLAQQGTLPGPGGNVMAQSDTGRFIATMGGAAPSAINSLNKSLDLPFRIWSAGAVQFGGLQSTGVYNNRFTTSGLTIGLDRQLAEGLVAGVAVGTAFDRTSINTDSTSMNARSMSATAYVSYRLSPHVFIDLAGGYAGLDFKMQRWSTDGNLFLQGSRTGSNYFGLLTLTQNVKWGALKLSPYARLQIIDVKLNPYTETGSANWALSYASLNSNSVSAVFGTRIIYPIAMDWGVLTPSTRLEYSHALGGAFAQNIAYADLAGQNYTINGVPTSTDLYTAGLMLKFELPSTLSFDVGYDFSVTGKQFQGNTIRFGASHRF